MPNVFITSEADDIGGVAAAIVRAFQRHGDEWNVTSMRGSNNYIDYPEINQWRPEQFVELYEQADLIHGMERLTNVETAIGRRLDKPAVLHHHGSEFRDRPRYYGDWAGSRNIPMICSTVDLTRLYSGTTWMPNPIPMGWLAWFRSQYQPPADERPYRIGHMPTQRHMKGTDVFLAAMDDCADVMPLMCEWQPWSTSLVTKAKCHAYFDQLLFGFGLSALEAWAMGLPVMTGCVDRGTIQAMLDHWGRIPFIEVRTQGDIADNANRLAVDPAYHDHWARVGNDFVREFHDERVVVEKLKALWGQTIDSYRP